ncbi:MAG: maleylpyruvate isomerase N-terminal domain-containing protein [Chloroflexota bacterium]
MSVQSDREAVRATTAWLHDELAALTPERWETPGACGVWSVAEVVAHLDWGARVYADAIQRALAGISEPPPDSGAIADYAARAAWFAQTAKRLRLELGDRLLDAYAESGQTLSELFGRLSDRDWQLTAPHPASPRPVRELLRLRTVELAIHGWDILHRLGRADRTPVLPAGSYEPIVEWLPRRIQGSFDRREPLPEPHRYELVLTAPLPRTVRLRVRGDAVDVDPEGDTSSADVALTLHPETYVLSFMGRLDWQDALASGAVSIVGNRHLAAELGSWLRPG